VTLQIFQRNLEVIDDLNWPVLPVGGLEIASIAQDSSDYLRVRADGKFGSVFVGNPNVPWDLRFLYGGRLDIWHVAKHLTHPTNHVFAVKPYNLTLPAPAMTLAQAKADYRSMWPHWRIAGTNPAGEPFNNVANLTNYGLTGGDVPLSVTPGSPWTPGGFVITSAKLTLPAMYAGLSPADLEAA